MPCIRNMTEADLDAVLAIEQVCFPRGWSCTHFQAELASERATCVVAEQDGLVAGYLCLTVLLDEAEILNVAVDPARQRGGIGNCLLQYACDEALRRGGVVLRLEVRATSSPAIALYQRWGFRQTGLRKGYYEDRIDAVLMDKPLIKEDVDAV